MIENKQFDAAWMGWVKVMREVAALTRKRELQTALSRVEDFLSSETHPEIRSDALGFSADLKGQLRDFEGATADLRTARSLVGPTYVRYVHELSLGQLCESRGLDDEARSWYRTALRTCLQGEGISGGTVLNQLHRLRPFQHLSAEDQNLCKDVVQRSWQVLRLPGKPDLSDLAGAILLIKEGETNSGKQG